MKKLFLALSTAALLFGLGACGNKKASSTPASSASGSGSASQSSSSSQGGGGEWDNKYTVTGLPNWIGADGCVIFAWTWSDTDAGSWHAITFEGDTGTFEVDEEKTGFNMARCTAGTTAPNWEIHDPDVTSEGRIFNKTGDVNCSAGTYSYVSPEWVEYH